MQLHLLILFLLINISIVDSAKSRKKSFNNKNIQNIAIDAYLYGYSLITSEITRVQMTNVAQRDVYKAPMGQFLNTRAYPSANYHGITAPNADTLYSAAWIDLDNEPWIFSHPDMGDRYYLFPIHNHWMQILESPGKRSTGSAAATYVVTGPKWNGTLPLNVQQRINKQINSPTRYVVILGRTYCNGTQEDYAAVHKLQDQYLLQPLSVFINNENKSSDTFIPSVSNVDPNPGFSMTNKVRNVINSMNIFTYFNMMALLMKDNPPLKQDDHIIKKMVRIGLIPGQTFDWAKLSRPVQIALKSVPKLAFRKISLFQRRSGIIQNGWIIPEIDGYYGIDYLRRAYVAAYLWPGNLPDDAIYPFTQVESNGRKLSGRYKYVLHFDKGQTPPVNAFWSITMYNSEYFFVNNSLNRYTLSPRDSLIYNPDDGSLDLYFQNTPPAMDKQNNWLPAPRGPFILMFRLYWPQFSFFSGNNQSWMIPPIKRLV